MRMLALAGAIVVVALGSSGCNQRPMSAAEYEHQQRFGDALMHMGSQMMMMQPRQDRTTYFMPNRTLTCTRYGDAVHCF